MTDSREEYQGTCPVCGMTLVREVGNLLVCVGGHYSTSRIEFEKIWGDFQKKFAGKKISLMTESDSDHLIKDLLAINIVEVKDSTG